MPVHPPTHICIHVLWMYKELSQHLEASSNQKNLFSRSYNWIHGSSWGSSERPAGPLPRRPTHMAVGAGRRLGPQPGLQFSACLSRCQVEPLRAWHLGSERKPPEGSAPGDQDRVHVLAVSWATWVTWPSPESVREKRCQKCVCTGSTVPGVWGGAVSEWPHR